MVVSNPRVYTTDSYNYQFIWDNCSNVDEEYNLFIHKFAGGLSGYQCVNPNSPIKVSYNKKITIATMEDYYYTHNDFITPELCLFEISDLNTASSEVSSNTCFPFSNNQDNPVKVGVIQAGNICKPFAQGEYAINYGVGAKNFLNYTHCPIDSYDLYISASNEGDNYGEWYYLQDVDEPSFKYMINSPLQKDTTYKGQIVYHRRGCEQTDYYKTLLSQNNSDVEVVIEKEDVWECVPIEWNVENENSNKSVILDITNDNLLYINSEIENTDHWKINLGNSINNGHVDTTNGQSNIEIQTNYTYHIGDYNYLEYSVNTNAEQPSGVYTKFLNTTVYKKPENQNIDYGAIFNFTTNTGYAHDLTAFNGEYNCSNYTGYSYKCNYIKKDLLDAELYIYQYNGSNYDLTLDLDSINSSSNERQFELRDPDVYSNIFTYDIVCSDIPVTDNNGNIVEQNITQEQINKVIKNLTEGQYNKISLYEIANYEISKNIGSFKEGFEWNKMYIEHDYKTDAPKLFIQGTRTNEEAMKSVANTYQIIIQNLIDQRFDYIIDLKYNLSTQKWEIKDENGFYGTDGFSLRSLQDVELGPQNMYKILVKAYSTNKKRHKVLQIHFLEYKNNFIFTKNLFKNYFPPNATKTKTEDFYANRNQTIHDINLKNVDFINIVPLLELEEPTYWIIDFGQKQKDSNNIFYYSKRSISVDSQKENQNIDVGNYDYITLTYRSPIPNEGHIKIQKVYNDFSDNYSNQPNKNFGFCAENKSNSLESFALMLYDNSLDNKKVSYFNYSANATNSENTNDKGLHIYDKNINAFLSKASIFPQNTKAVTNVDDEKIFLDFSIEEMEQKNCIINNQIPEFTPLSPNTDINKIENNKKIISLIGSATGRRIGINFNKDVILNSIKNLTINCGEFTITNALGEVLYHVTNTYDFVMSFDNKYINTSQIYFIIKNGSVSSDDLQIITLEKAEGAEGKGKRNRTFKTENIDLYISNSSNNTIDYSIVNNGEVLTGRVLDNNKPVNFYIESFADLNNDKNGDLIYKIEKVQEKYDYLTLPAEDNNTVIITQQNKNNEEEFFDKEFYINSDTNKLKITNTNTNKITFTQNQTDTIVNCVLEKKETDS